MDDDRNNGVGTGRDGWIFSVVRFDESDPQSSYRVRFEGLTDLGDAIRDASYLTVSITQGPSAVLRSTADVVAHLSLEECRRFLAMLNFSLDRLKDQAEQVARGYIAGHGPLSASRDWHVLPGEVIQERMDVLGMSVEAFSRDYHVDESWFREVLAGRASITYNLAVELDQALGVSSGFWLGLQKSYDDLHSSSA